MSAHEEVVAEILAALGPNGGEVRLIGRVSDPVLGNPSMKEVYLFVPDLHVLSPGAATRYKYKFNHEDKRILVKILTQLTGLRARWEMNGPNKLVTVQLGDFYDLWREGSRDVLFEWQSELRNLLYRGGDLSPMKPYLNATMMLGNHDTLEGQPLEGIKLNVKWYNRVMEGAPDKPFLFATHGDTFDLLEKEVDDPIQEFLVYWLAPAHGSGTKPLSTWAQLSERYNANPKSMKFRIQKEEHDLRHGAPEAVTVRPGSEAVLPSIMAQTIAAPDEAAHDFFEKMYESLQAADPGAICEKVRIAVIGHTHHARMVFLNSAGRRPLLLIDAGAWIEKCRYLHAGKEVVEESAQLAVVHGNDARLYQISISPQV